jgi:hypothetical protein
LEIREWQDHATSLQGSRDHGSFSLFRPSAPFAEVISRRKVDVRMMVDMQDRILEKDRRKATREKSSMPARVRTSNPAHEDEVRTSVNRSDQGIYFTTWNEHYCVGMSLGITFPYSSAIELYSSERKAEVVRIEKLTDGRLGIAVKMLSD